MVVHRRALLYMSRCVHKLLTEQSTDEALSDTAESLFQSS